MKRRIGLEANRAAQSKTCFEGLKSAIFEKRYPFGIMYTLDIR